MTEYKDKNIAVVGVSFDESKYGYRIFQDLLNAGFKVFGINPRGGELLEQKIYPSLKDLGFVPDLVLTVVPPVVTENIIGEASELGIKEIWMQPGSQSDEVVELAKSFGMKVTHDSCFMVYNKIW